MSTYVFLSSREQLFLNTGELTAVIISVCRIESDEVAAKYRLPELTFPCMKTRLNLKKHIQEPCNSLLTY